MILRSTLHLQAILVLVVWSLWFALGGGVQLFDVLAEHWRVSLTMAFGSLISGATAEGGGAVAFPVFTKVLHIAPADARVFALAIQSVGMSAATLVILARGIRVEWRYLGWASLGGLVGLPLGALLFAPMVSPPMTRMVFTVMQASFALALLALNWRDRACHERLPRCGPAERSVLAVAGFVGGIMTGLVGTGLDILTFSVVVLLFRLSEKVATPTSVVLMAGNSLAGFALYGWGLGSFTPEIRDWWLAAVPVVVLGAPIGAIFCSLIGRLAIARILIGLIAIEVITSLILIPLDSLTIAVSACALLTFGFLYLWMYRQTTYQPDTIPPACALRLS
jgi:uncharacterized membrane protein YfcA